MKRQHATAKQQYEVMQNTCRMRSKPCFDCRTFLVVYKNSDTINAVRWLWSLSATHNKSETEWKKEEKNSTKRISKRTMHFYWAFLFCLTVKGEREISASVGGCLAGFVVYIHSRIAITEAHECGILFGLLFFLYVCFVEFSLSRFSLCFCSLCVCGFVLATARRYGHFSRY